MPHARRHHSTSLHQAKLVAVQAGVPAPVPCSCHMAAEVCVCGAQVPAFGKIRQQHQQQRKLSMREKLKYEYRMMTTAFSGRLPIVAADPAEAQVQMLAQTCLRNPTL